MWRNSRKVLDLSEFLQYPKDTFMVLGIQIANIGVSNPEVI